eukprot:764022-Hanusia_phi.AAC.4
MCMLARLTRPHAVSKHFKCGACILSVAELSNLAIKRGAETERKKLSKVVENVFFTILLLLLLLLLHRDFSLTQAERAYDHVGGILRGRDLSLWPASAIRYLVLTSLTWRTARRSRSASALFHLRRLSQQSDRRLGKAYAHEHVRGSARGLRELLLGGEDKFLLPQRHRVTMRYQHVCQEVIRDLVTPACAHSQLSVCAESFQLCREEDFAMQEDEVDGMTTMKREIEQEDVGVAADSEVADTKGEISTLILPGFKGSDRDKQQNEEKKSCAEHETSAYGLVQELFSMSCADFEVEVCVRCGNRERCEEKARQCLHGKSHGLPKDFPSGEVHNVKVNYGREMRRYAVKDYDELLEAMHKVMASSQTSKT